MKYDPKTMSREDALERYDELNDQIAKTEAIVVELKAERSSVRAIVLGTMVAVDTGRAPRVGTRLPSGEVTQNLMKHLNTGPATTRELMEATGYSYPQVQMALNKARERHLVRQRQDKYWETAIHPDASRQTEG